MKHHRIIMALGAVALILTSCNGEFNESPKNKKQIRIKVSTASSAETKSGTSVISEPIELDADGIKLSLAATVSANEMSPFDFAPVTKGEIIKTESFGAKRGAFFVEIPAAKMVTKTTASYDGSGWALDAVNGAKAEWIGDGSSLDFYAYSYAGNDDFSFINADFFEYEAGSCVAEEQQDLLYTHVTASEGSEVDIHFYHALAAVRFVIGDLKEGCYVEKLAIKNVLNSGRAIYDGEGQFSWKFNSQDDYVDYYQTYDETDRSKYEYLGYLDDSELKCTFFVIPQAVEGSYFEITLNDGEKSYTVTTDVPTLKGGWQAGYFYTYSVSGGNGSVDLDVYEYTNGNLAPDNTGSLATYVRAAVAGNWFLGGKIVGPWLGEITKDSGWELGSDGFYYLLEPLPGKTTAGASLIEGYARGEAPVNGAQLKLDVAMQAVEYKGVGIVPDEWDASVYAK